MQSRVLFVCCLATIVLIAGTLVAQEDRHFIESPAFENRERPGVEFDHLLHYELYECTDCHHDYVDGENVWSMEKNYCSDCHTVEGHYEDDVEVMGLMEAFHEQCIDCHQEAHAQDQATGPIMCGECHVR
jgi:hypothetical protein